ncbi:MAG: hypothetical protein J1E39_05220 [Eubacterium sp.]|nr:hypothetical protein [Eubacterium sp.]
MLIIAVLVFATWFIIKVNNVEFNVYTRGFFTYADGLSAIESEELEREFEANGYFANVPFFEHSFYEGNRINYDVYVALNSPLDEYVSENVYKYNNYLKLDYELEIIENETLTVTFTGEGYPDEGNGEPESLDKTFVFDIKDVGPNNLPTLIE